jgi:uncharacterized glyoxalase superfamily protein PhnB
MAETTHDTAGGAGTPEVKGQAGAPDHFGLDVDALARLPNIFPGLRYRDAPAMIEWLRNAFGFEPHAVYPDGEGGIAHAELRLGAGLVMLGSVRDDGAGFGAPGRSDGDDPVPPRTTVQLFVALPPGEVAPHFDQARNAGAEIVQELAETDFGTEQYIARDPEGHQWVFGSYQPLAGDLVAEE